MRFSLKWLLAAVAYAAVVCASVVYAGEAYNFALSVFGLSSIGVCSIGALTSKDSLRAWCVGFAVAGLLFGTVVLGKWTVVPDVRKVLNTAIEHAVIASQIERRAGDDQLIAERRLVIGELDVLGVKVAGTPEPGEIDGPYQVGVDGAIVLGRGYGTVRVAGMTVEAAEQAVTDRLTSTLTEPEVAVTMKESFRSVTASRSPRANPLAVAAARQHLILLFSLLGGLLGLWFWKREEGDKALRGMQSESQSPGARSKA